MRTKDQIEDLVVDEVRAELYRADEKHKNDPMVHMRVGFKTLECEVKELEREVERFIYEAGNPALLHREAVQVAAMALKFLRDISFPLTTEVK
jgi:hypothetical protein